MGAPGGQMAMLTQQELERHLWGAADIPRDTVDAGDYKQYIFGLLFFKRLCDVWDEEYEVLLAETGHKDEAAEPDEHRFHIPQTHRWEAVRKQARQIDGADLVHHIQSRSVLNRASARPFV